jgi:CRISPR-associated RAMP protein (TIGR02581 family)
MHKQLVNEIEIELELVPDGPVIIKASDSNDPTRPDMEFVRTRQGARQTIYLPGSSLKGAFRSHCEKLARTIQTTTRTGEPGLLACNPVARDRNEACGSYLGQRENRNLSTAELYAKSCFVCRIFGNTSLGSRLRITDAMPFTLNESDETNPNRHTEQRNGVAIDRLFGSAVGGALFNFEVTTAGKFITTLSVRNFTMAQLGLLGIMLRDLERQRLVLGFGKSRGLGRITLGYRRVSLRYPLATLSEDNRFSYGSRFQSSSSEIFGIGTLLPAEMRRGYGLEENDRIRGPYSLGPEAGNLEKLGDTVYDVMDGVSLTINQEENIKAFWRSCAVAWQSAATRSGGQAA